MQEDQEKEPLKVTLANVFHISTWKPSHGIFIKEFKRTTIMSYPCLRYLDYRRREKDKLMTMKMTNILQF